MFFLFFVGNNATAKLTIAPGAQLISHKVQEYVSQLCSNKRLMAPNHRINLPGGLYHNILRGNGGQDIFLADADRYRLFLLLQESTCRFGYQVHAFCFMTNYLYLVLQVDKIPLSCGLQNFSFRYTRWGKGQEIWTGHLFQGRYKGVQIHRNNVI